MTLPLLIGGATTTRQHTAVKIAPEYAQPMVHVLDASRAVGVVATCSSRSGASGSTATTARTRSGCASSTRSAERKPLLAARGGAGEPARRSRSTTCPSPRSPARGSSSCRSESCGEYIDWTFFFTPGSSRAHSRRSSSSRRRASSTTTRSGCSTASSTSGCSRARRLRLLAGDADGDDVSSSGDDGETRFCFLRQQADDGDTRPNRCLADFVAPAGDHVGAFAVTAGIGADELAARFEAEHDDYNAIMVKALADRLAEAFAEYLHERAPRVVRSGAKLEPAHLIEERYRGIRPAFGYPACPDHSEKLKLFELLGAETRRDRAHRVVRDDARPRA